MRLKLDLVKIAKYPLIMPSMPNVVWVTTNTIPNLQKMGCFDHDLCKFLQLVMDRYMTTFRETKDGPMHMVPREWERGLDKYGLFSLMHMPHFGCTTEVNANVLNNFSYHSMADVHGLTRRFKRMLRS